MDFKTWEQKATSIETKEIGRNIVRDIYVFPNGIRCMEDFITPWNPFKKSFSRIIVDFIVPINTIIEGAEVSGDYYTEDGFGVPVFSEMESAFNFAINLRRK